MQTKDQNKLLFYFLVVLSIFIILFFAKDYFNSIQENKDSLSVIETELNDKRAVLTKLEELNRTININNSGGIDEIKKYVHEIKEDELLDYFYSYVYNSRNGSGYILIDNISFDKGTTNEYGFNEGTITLSLTVSDEYKMFEMLDFIISPNSAYKLFIDNFSFPNDKTEGSFNISLPLRIFYK
nr:hypothetical protein [Candidatus Gracilibacteria bacterium]